jgi:UDP-glucose 4-epimerase
MKMIFITGGSGYLGTVLIKKLLKKKYKVINLDPLFFSSSTYNQLKNKDIKHFVGITEDEYILDEIFQNNKIDSIIHLSGVSNDPTALLNSELTEKSNVYATKLLVNKAKKK